MGMNEHPRPGDELLLEKVQQARRMSFEDKFLAGPRLFDLACRLMRDGIRMQFPNADETEVERLFLERLAIQRRLEARRS
jgi:hypothetical protein